ncbi:MAG: 1-acyl-sn-glycerol-3-phosphate acyltransferase [Saprospiraceae bacterium]|nr:1-acyl-sn-glycerol-3-phosphate acyltransferase [Saprospiraceae bacterium]
MLYPITRPLVAIALRVYYPKIFISHADRIPTGQPVILAANHPTAFVEPCVLACFLDRPLYFLVRGDLFRKDFYASLLRDLHMLPVYRLRDGGISGIRKNYSTFEACYEALAEQKTLMILAEGRTRQEKRLHPLKKGTARIALGTLAEKEVADVAIVPVGVNFTQADRFRSEVMIDFGRPISAAEYLPGYRENRNRAIEELTEDLAGRMRERIVSIERSEDEELTEQMLILLRNQDPDSRFPVVENSFDRLRREIDLADRINRMGGENRQKLEQLAAIYFRRLKELGLTDRVVASESGPSVGGILAVLLGLIPFLAGLITNVIPAGISRRIVDTQVRQREFYSPVLMGMGAGIYIVYLFTLVILAIVFGKAWFWLVVIATPFLGVFALYYREWALEQVGKWRYGRLDPDKREDLHRRRRELIRRIGI